MTQQTPPVLVVPIIAFVLAAVAAAGAGVFMAVGTAHAEIEGPCQATIAGVDVAGLDEGDPGAAIRVNAKDRVTATMSSETGFQRHKIVLKFLGDVFPSQTVEDRTDEGEFEFTETVNVKDYARWGVGLYRVSGVATLADGTRCSGGALVRVTGRNPLTTVVGGVATGAVALGTAGALASGAFAATRRPGALGPIGEIVEEAWQDQQNPSGAAARAAARRREQAVERGLGNAFWAASLFGCLCFAAFAMIMTPLMALLVLLQQFAVIYPRMSHLIILLVVGAVVYGLVIPTLGYTIGWLRVNGKIARVEREARSRG